MSLWGDKYTSKFGETKMETSKEEAKEAVETPVKLKKSTDSVTKQTLTELVSSAMAKMDISMWELLHIAGYSVDVTEKDTNFDDFLEELGDVEEEIEQYDEVDMDDFCELKMLLLICGITNLRVDEHTEKLIYSELGREELIDLLFELSEGDEFELSNPERIVLLRSLYPEKVEELKQGGTDPRLVELIEEMEADDSQSTYSAKDFAKVASLFGMKFESFKIMVK